MPLVYLWPWTGFTALDNLLRHFFVVLRLFFEIHLSFFLKILSKISLKHRQHKRIKKTIYLHDIPIFYNLVHVNYNNSNVYTTSQEVIHIYLACINIHRWYSCIQNIYNNLKINKKHALCVQTVTLISEKQMRLNSTK